VRAQTLFLQKHGAFKVLCRLYADKVSEWTKLDRNARIREGKDVQCVYRHNTKKGGYDWEL
jgi:hypothetical protein